MALASEVCPEIRDILIRPDSSIVRSAFLPSLIQDSAGTPTGNGEQRIGRTYGPRR